MRGDHGEAEAAAAGLLEALTAAEVLITRPDAAVGELVSASAAGSSPPWNAQAAAVVMDAHAGLRRLEAELRAQVSGSWEPWRGGSDRNTVAAVASILRLVEAVPEQEARRVVRALERYAEAGMRLPGIDTAQRWRPVRLGSRCRSCNSKLFIPAPEVCGHCGHPVRPPACPYCELFLLRLAEGTFTVACFNPDCPRLDKGRRPQARLQLREVRPFDPVLVWDDGLIQSAPALWPGGWRSPLVSSPMCWIRRRRCGR